MGEGAWRAGGGMEDQMRKGAKKHKRATQASWYINDIIYVRRRKKRERRRIKERVGGLIRMPRWTNNQGARKKLGSRFG
jgi:hypothetical protein